MSWQAHGERTERTEIKASEARKQNTASSLKAFLSCIYYAREENLTQNNTRDVESLLWLPDGGRDYKALGNGLGRNLGKCGDVTEKDPPQMLQVELNRRLWSEFQRPDCLQQ